MDELIRGTTPSYNFVDFGFDPGNITAATFIVKQAKNVIIEKELADATVSEDAVRWTLTQAETLRLDPKLPAVIYCIWKNGETRGESQRLTVEVRDTDKNEEM